MKDRYNATEECKVITQKEIDAIRFYQGDVWKRNINGKIMKKEQQEGFWGIQGAYQTMNCLMFEGCDNEKERIQEGNKELVPNIFLEIDKVVEIYCDIYRAMCKKNDYSRENRCVYRTDRGVSVEELKKGYTISFMSTFSEIDKDPEKFFQKKRELVILLIKIPSGIPCLDLNEILGKDNRYAKQGEVLLPPFLKISYEELELTEAEKQYRDADNKPPKAKYLIVVKKLLESKPECLKGKADDLTEERNKEAAEILTKLINKEYLEKWEEEMYCQWKRDFRRLIWEKFEKIRCQKW